MLSQVHASGLHRKRSLSALRTDKKPLQLARRSRPGNPGLAPWTSPLCDVLPRPADKATEDGYLQLSSVCHFMIGNYRFALDFG